MPKIDTTSIEGYADMTPEEKVAALEAVEYEDGSADIKRYKDAASKANSEAAEWKKKHNALLSEDEQKKAAQDEELSTLRSELERLKKNETVATYKASYLSMGYDDALATATAKALAEGDINKVFENQRKYVEAHDKSLKAELLKGTSTPPAGAGTGDVDYTQKAAQAQTAGNYSEAAYYLRLAQEASKN